MHLNIRHVTLMFYVMHLNICSSFFTLSGFSLSVFIYKCRWSFLGSPGSHGGGGSIGSRLILSLLIFVIVCVCDRREGEGCYKGCFSLAFSHSFCFFERVWSAGHSPGWSCCLRPPSPSWCSPPWTRWILQLMTR